MIKTESGTAMQTPKSEITDHSTSPIGFFLTMLLVIFCGEMLIMYHVLPWIFGEQQGILRDLLDAFLLTLMASPILWLVIVRPLRKSALAIKEKNRQILETQQELVRSEKLAVLGQLSGSVGHELRNPLSVMNNAVYILKASLAGADEPVKDYLQIIEDEIAESRRIITDLLDFTRTTPPHPLAISAVDLISDSLGRCAIAENIDLQVDIATSLPRLMVDPLQMSQVLQNLITNACQAMPAGGPLRLAAHALGDRGRGGRSRVATHIDPSPTFVAINIEDGGEGIAPENIGKLFQPLFTTKTNGIGLGLVVSKNLTEANGGRIEVASVVGKGTTFSVMLPVAEPA